MKKAIRILLCVLAVSLFATSCTKTTLNSIFVSGKWQLTHIVTSVGEKSETYRPSQEGKKITYEFFNDGFVEYQEIDVASTLIVKEERGSWGVDNNVLIIKLSGASKEYHIDTANLTDLILFRDFTLVGTPYHEVTTLSKF